jgi:high-affinity Fe2+/Pb2+ permease
MISRTAKAAAVFGSPIYLLPLGPFAIVGIPLLTATLGREVWPQHSRRRLFAVGCATVATAVGVFFIAVFWFYGLAGPTGAWFWVGPLVGLIVYVVGCIWAMRRPWRWPLATAVALLSVAAVGLLAVAMGVRFEA